MVCAAGRGSAQTSDYGVAVKISVLVVVGVIAVIIQTHLNGKSNYVRREISALLFVFANDASPKGFTYESYMGHLSYVCYFRGWDLSLEIRRH